MQCNAVYIYFVASIWH